MGSKNRIGNKLRQSARFKALEAELERLDLPFTVHAPTGCGHPFIQIAIPGRDEPLKHHVACTPHEKSPSAQTVGYLRRALRLAGVAV